MRTVFRSPWLIIGVLLLVRTGLAGQTVKSDVRQGRALVIRGATLIDGTGGT